MTDPHPPSKALVSRRTLLRAGGATVAAGALSFAT